MLHSYADCFGENETYTNVQGAWKLRLWLNSWGMVAIAPFGRWWCPLLPRDRRMHIVVGATLPPPLLSSTPAATGKGASAATPASPTDGGRRVATPSDADVKAHHAAYVAALTALFDRHKASYGYGDDVKLEVW